MASQRTSGRKRSIEKDNLHPDESEYKKANRECAVWIHTGQSSDMAIKHKMDHPYTCRTKASLFATYLSYQDVHVNLNEESLLCKHCYNDAYTNCNASPTIPPRWFRLKIKNQCPSAMHCSLCHQEWEDKSTESPCKSSSRFLSFSTWGKINPFKFGIHWYPLTYHISHH